MQPEIPGPKAASLARVQFVSPAAEAVPKEGALVGTSARTGDGNGGGDLIGKGPTLSTGGGGGPSGQAFDWYPT